MKEPDAESERRRLFRQMRWIYVYLPPILLLIAAGIGALMLAAVSAGTGLEFRERLGASALFIIAATALILIVQRRSKG